MSGLCWGVSKAFTRESDDASGDEIAPLRSQIPPQVKRYITNEGADRFRQQATILMGEKHALLTGSNSGSADTTARVRQIDAAIQKIQRIMDSVMVAGPPTDADKVGFGASVHIRDNHGEEETYQIVGPDEAEPGEGRISSISPLAQALLNSRVGDTVRFSSPAGEQELTILAVGY